MAVWNLISMAPRNTGRPLLLYPRPKESLGASHTSVFEGYWDGQQWRTALAAPCFPSHWMPMPAPPLSIVSPQR
jgi:hypothetical protein